MKFDVAPMEAAIRDPIGSAPLWEIVSPGQTVAFIVYNPARATNSHIVLPVLIDEIHAVGVPYEDMCIVFAVGAHRPLTETEMAEKAGLHVASRLKQFNSDGDLYADARVVGAKHVVLTGSVEGLADLSDPAVNPAVRRPSFLLDVVLNADNQFLKIFAGHYVLAHREACAFAEEVSTRLRLES